MGLKTINLQPSIVSVETNDILKIQNIFPNPSNGHFKLSGIDLTSILNLYLTDLKGEITKLNKNDYNIKNNILEFNLNNLMTGLYYLNIETTNFKFNYIINITN